jgi:hypothetical protein
MSSRPVSRRPRLVRLVGAGAVVVAAAALVLPAGEVTAEAAGDVQPTAGNPVTPGSFTGYAFDQCLAPTQKAMDAWLKSSPFWAVGIYISGNSRHCRNQPNLTPTWVSTQLAKGWRLLPITLGPQAYCNSRYPKYNDDPVIKRRMADNYAAALNQGVSEANKAVSTAAALGIVRGSTLWYDLEAFDIKNTGCRKSAMRFLSGWTEQLQRLGYVSGAYSSGASGIKAIDDARVGDATFTEPDMIWVADWNGKATVQTPWLRTGSWLPGRRVHQYRGGHNETHGGVTINIDSNFLDLGKGSVAVAAATRCGGVRVDFTRYPRLGGTRVWPEQTRAAQCLLKEKGVYGGMLSGVYSKRTAAAVARYRAQVSLTPGTKLTRRTWVALLSSGSAPLLKYGAASEDVRRLQRALTATGNPVAITGTFESTTTSAVKVYQRALDRRMTGVVTPKLWSLLRAGTI